MPETVVVLGLARQGTALVRFFAERGARVVASDSRVEGQLTEAMAELADLNVAYVLGEHPLSLLDGCDLLCLSGGVPPDLPVVQEALHRDIPLSNDAQEFMLRCPAPVIGITGSAGKTTTTTLVGLMLEASGSRTFVGGNIGNPLINELPRIRPTDRVVMELSSFQLELMHTSPHIAGVLNITPNHLDRHKTMEAYIAAKRHIVAYQGPDDIAVLGLDDPNARALSSDTRAHVRYFSGCETPLSSEGPGESWVGAFLRDDQLVLRTSLAETPVVSRDAIRLKGFHNVMNVLASIALADAGGASLDGMRHAIGEFRGVPHRLEEVGSVNGALWINDSIATAPERVIAALEAFDVPLVLLAGGRDKDLPWARFAALVVERVRVLVLFGEAAPLIRGIVDEALSRSSPEQVGLQEVVMAGTLEGAVEAAAGKTEPGDVVLLSPGGTSFDAFRDFAARGDRFRELVDNLGRERDDKA